MSCFRANMLAIKQQHFTLYEQIEKYLDTVVEGLDSPASPSDVEIQTARDGSLYLRVQKDGKWTALNSTYSPKKEAETFCKNYGKLPLYARVIMFGLGSGVFAKRLISMNEGKHMETEDAIYSRPRYLLYEPDLELFLFSLQHFDFTDLFENPDVTVLVENLNHDQLMVWCSGNVEQLNFHAFQVIAIPKYKDIYPEIYQKIMDTYADVRARIEAYSGTKTRFSKSILKNNLKNLQYFVQAQNLREFVERYPKDLPYLVVAAGPSLAKSIDTLREIQQDVFLMAVDTAAGYLIDKGIVPDGIMVIDPEKTVTLFHEGMREIPFFVHADANYAILDFVKPKRVYFISTNLEFYRSYAYGEGDRIDSLDTGGSVATMAFSFAEYIGVDTILLMGQDLAYEGTASHVNQTDAIARDFIQVPGNQVEVVDTIYNLYVYLLWFQCEIAKKRVKRIINATMGGARIEGAEYLYGEALVDAICNKEYSAKKQTFLQEIGLVAQNALAIDTSESTQQCTLQVETIYQQLHAQLTKVKALIAEAIGLAAQGKTIVSVEGVHAAELDAVNRKLDCIAKKLMELTVLEWLEGFAKEREDEVMMDLYEEKASETEYYLEAYSKLEQYYGFLEEARAWISVELLKGIP